MKYLLLLALIGFALAVPTPVQDVVTTATCPVDHEILYNLCGADCLADHDCNQGKKCCNTVNCGMECLTPVVTPEDEDVKTKEEITELLTTILAERRDLTEKLEMYPPPLLRFVAMKNRTDVTRICVTNPCELRKCQRIAQELTYNILPRKEFFCMAATTTKQCLFWVERGWSDIVMARDLDIYHAKTKFNVTAIAQERITGEGLTTIEEVTQNITLVVTSVTSDIENLNQLAGRKICSAGINDTASFINPICSLIKKNIIPVTGNVIESAADFFGDMCIPGALNTTLANRNDTLPLKLMAACNNQEAEYSGIVGSLKCVGSGHGDITFVDHKVVKYLMTVPTYNAGLNLVCGERKLPLTSWMEKSCQIAYTPRPIMFMSPHRNDVYVQQIQAIMTAAMKLKTAKVSALDLFDSSDYTCINTDPRDLIFLDDSTSFAPINETVVQQKIEAKEYFKMYNVCESLVPKPRVKFCTTTPEQYRKCNLLKIRFNNHDELKKMAWGCVLAKTELDCMRNVLNGTADLYSGNVKEVFIGGHDFLLQPILMQDQVVRTNIEDYVTKVFGTHSVAVMKKSKLWRTFGEDVKVVNIRNLTVCSPGIDEVGGFHLPIGRMLSNNIIPRIGSVFESVNRFFKKACIPGANPVSYKHDMDLILGHEFNWGIPGLNFYNFTGFNWFVWNSPHTWNFYNYNRKTPGTLMKFMKNRLLIPIMEGKLSLPAEFDADTFDYSILEDVLSVEGLGDILSDIPESIRDSLVDNRQTRTNRNDRFRDMFEEQTGNKYVAPRDRRLGRQTIRSYMQKSFDSMQDEWGIFEGVDRPVATTPRKHGMTLTGGQVSNMRSAIDDRVDESDPSSIVSNLLESYDSEYTVPLISKIFSHVLKERFERLDGLAERMDILHRVPTMTNIFDEDYKWINHPSVQAFLKIYAPKLVNSHSDLFDNTEIAAQRNSRYLNPLWLTPTYPEFLDTMKKNMLDLTKVCQGYAEHKGELSPNEPFYGIHGSFECIKDDNEGEIAFVELEKFVTEITKHGQTVSEYVIITPVGIVKEISNEMIENREFLRNVTFGTIPYPAVMTAFNRTGSYRWNVTRALLTAQKLFSTPETTSTGFTLFGSESIFSPTTTKLIPIPIQDQSHITYLGPNLTRSIEAILKPSTYDWWKERRTICSGEMYSNVIEQQNGTCKAIVKDVTCSGMPRPKVISVGTTENKQPIVVKMCSRPTRFIREKAEFVCNNGHGYLTSIMVPTTCECVPCEEIEYEPDWTKDPFWASTTDHVHTVTEEFENNMPLWGNHAYWHNHTLNPNYHIADETPVTTTVRVGNTVGRTVVIPIGTCEANWLGYNWRTEWFPNTDRPVCLGNVVGLRRMLTTERLTSKITP